MDKPGESARPLAGVSIIVLAAGRGTRMGGPKALMEVRGRAWWVWQRERLAAAARGGARVWWVVSPVVAQAMEQAKELGGGQERMVMSDPAAPMFASVRAGLAAVFELAGAGRALAERAVEAGGSDFRGAFVLPVDVPAARVETLARLAELGRDGPVAPAHQGVAGHPVWLPRRWIEGVFWPAVKGAGGGATADRELRLDEMLAGAIGIHRVEDAAVTVNLNTPEDVAVWLASEPMAVMEAREANDE